MNKDARNLFSNNDIKSQNYKILFEVNDESYKTLKIKDPLLFMMQGFIQEISCAECPINGKCHNDPRLSCAEKLRKYVLTGVKKK